MKYTDIVKSWGLENYRNTFYEVNKNVPIYVLTLLIFFFIELIYMLF